MPESTLAVTLRYYGHCAFQWRTRSGVRVLIDPYRNREDRCWFLRPFPPVESDLVLVTHAHFDHDAADRLPGTPTLVRGPGRFSLEDVVITGVSDFHSLPRFAQMPNVIFVVEAGGLRFCHIGDNRSNLPAEVHRALGAVDVLMVTVDDSCHLLTYQEVDALVRRLNPRVVVPTHYYIEGINAEGCGLEPPDRWLATQERVRRLETDTLTLSPSHLPARREVWVLAPANFAKERPA